MVVTTRGGFRNLTLQVASAFGMPDARVVTIDHPLGGIDEKLVVDRAHTIIEEVLRLWTA